MSDDDATPDAQTPEPDTTREADLDDATQPVKDLLAEHVPLALLVDLVAPEATSAEILEAEGLPEVAWWEPEPDPTSQEPEPES